MYFTGFCSNKAFIFSLCILKHNIPGSHHSEMFHPNAAVPTATAAAHHHSQQHQQQEVPQKPRFLFKMPRVVPNQKEKFETDEFMKRHSREAEVRNKS